MNYWFGQIPVGWRVMKLKHLCQIKTQKTNIKTNYVGLENITSGTSEFVFVETEPEGDNLIFNKNDVLFGKLRPYLAKVWLADKDGCCSSEFLVLHSDILIPEYLKYLLLSPKFIDRVNGSTFGSKMPRANWEFIGNQWMLVPPGEEQQEIVDELNGKISVVDKLTNDVNRKIKLLSEYRQALIDFKVSGGGGQQTI